MQPLKILRTTSLLVLLSSLSACSYLKPYKAPITQGTIIKQEQVRLLQAGLTTEQVQTILGPPYGKDPFNPLHWEYVFYTTDQDYYPDSTRYLALNFDSDLYLVDWTTHNKEVELNKDDSFLGKIFSDD